jgi:hypothetical protein
MNQLTLSILATIEDTLADGQYEHAPQARRHREPAVTPVALWLRSTQFRSIVSAASRTLNQLALEIRIISSANLLSSLVAYEYCGGTGAFGRQALYEMTKAL